MNLGARALERIINQRGIRQKVAAKESGVPESKLSRILSGKALPNLAEAVALRSWGAIDPALWEENEPANGEAPTDPAPAQTGTEGR